MRTAAFLVLTALAAGCSRRPARPPVPFDPQRFITTTLQTAAADTDLGVMAARRGRTPETRQLGAVIHRRQLDMQRALMAIAQQRQMHLSNAVEPRKVALRENLEILQGQVFDRGYALAMLQDMNAMSAAFQRAAKSNDPALATFATQYLPRIAEQRELAARLLSDLGGSPFV